MTTFAYRGRSPSGGAVSGERIADSVDAAVASLRRERILVTKIAAVATPPPSRRRGALGRRVAPKTLAVFTRQFSVMIDAGLPLVDCLEILGQQEADAGFRTTLLRLRADVEGGAGLAEAMRRHPRSFDALYTSMIAAGEASGLLDTILGRLATFIEQHVKLRAHVTAALAYPGAVIVIAGAVVAAILWKVVPVFASLFEGLGAVLPWPTRIVIGVSESFVGLFPLLVGAGVVAGVVLRRYSGTDAGRRVIDGLLLRLPVVGGVLRKVAVARFCRTLATLLGSGIPILEGLAITAKTAGNAVVEDAVMTARNAIEGGESVSAPLRRAGVFPPMVTQMVNVGETTGTLDVMLAKIAAFYEDEVDVGVKSLLTLLEPALIACLGVVVGGIVIAMYMPILDLIARMAG